MERDEPAGELLEGGWQSEVRRIGSTVRRPGSAWSPTVLALLRHLEEIGFEGAPRPIGSGIDDDGREQLSFIDGVSPQPAPWSDNAIAVLGGMLAELHTATRSFRPPGDAHWQSWYCRDLGDAGAGIGHGDLGPWNVMAVGGLPVGFIDWDTAGPFDPRYEVAQVAWLNVQLHDDDIAEAVGLGSAESRATQLRLFVDAYGLADADRRGFVDRMIEVAVRDAASEAVMHEVSPATTTGIAEDGYPFAWGIAWRVRSAAWMLRHRSLLEGSILR